VTRAELEADVGPLAVAGGHEGRSPGRLATHYAPRSPVRIDVEVPRDGEAYLSFGPYIGAGSQSFTLSASGDLREAAANLFRMLREADRSCPVAIAVAPIPHEGLGEALNDRLKRAAGFVG
jgi:L-threonylcarbamoyladenylate synthase